MKLQVTLEIDTELDVTPEQVTDFVMSQVDEMFPYGEFLVMAERFEDNELIKDPYEPTIRHIKTEKIEDWIEWTGGECPVDQHTVVEVMLRDGYTYTRLAQHLRWSFGQFTGEATSTDDIVKYRVVE